MDNESSKKSPWWWLVLVLPALALLTKVILWASKYNVPFASYNESASAWWYSWWIWPSMWISAALAVIGLGGFSLLSTRNMTTVWRRVVRILSITAIIILAFCFVAVVYGNSPDFTF